MVLVEIPSENMRTLHPGQVGDTFLVTVQGKGFSRSLSADKPMFKLRKQQK